MGDAPATDWDTLYADYSSSMVAPLATGIKDILASLVSADLTLLQFLCQRTPVASKIGMSNM